MKFSRRFTTDGRDAFKSVRYETRTSIIRRGGTSEEARVEAPQEWSQTAVDILVQKYMRRRDVPVSDKQGKPKLDAQGRPVTTGETSVKQVVDRLAGCWRHWGETLGYFDGPADAQVFYDEIVHMLLHQMAAPNSPQWFNTGLHWKYGITGGPQGHFYVNPADDKITASTDAYSRPQPHACFIQSVEDDLLGDHGVYGLLAKEGRIFKYGSGTGTNFSSVRGVGEPLKGGGVSSGLMSFLKVFDRAAGAIKSGGTTRRAAKMVCLDMDHPEIEDFILWKSREEAKVAALVAGSRMLRRAEEALARAAGSGDDGAEALQAAGSAAELIPEGFLFRARELADQKVDRPAQTEYDTGFEGEAYATVSGQNSNNSVRVPNRFLEAAAEGQDWNLTTRTDGKTAKTVKAAHLWNLVALAAWECADPGVQFEDTINEWHTCPKDGSIRASNPCSEYMFLDDTACNLASLNLVRFQNEDGSLRVDEFLHAVRLWTVVLDISVGMAQFPSPEIARKSFDYRTLGLGYANLGAFLMRAGVPYDSPEASAWTGSITALMGGGAYAASAEMAEKLGAFPRFAPNRADMLRVIRNHVRAAHGRDATATGLGDFEGLSVRPKGLDASACPEGMAKAARKIWDAALERGEKHGYRNAQVTVLAPTGTIGLVMDCDTTGIEPDFSLVKFKKLSGGGFIKIVNRSVPAALKKLGYAAPEAEAIVTYCLGSGTLEGAPHVNRRSLEARGFTEAKIAAVEKSLASSLSLSDAFSAGQLGRDFLLSLGVPEAALRAGGQEVLAALGFTAAQLEEADLAVCGAQTLEGAPGLDIRHYPVFDCANPCGRGRRSIAPSGHLRIMAAAQPFLSGAISKTVNLPNQSSVEDIRGVYLSAWKLMIKAVAVYRDGCKLSQPLTSKAVTGGKTKAAAAAKVTPVLPVVKIDHELPKAVRKRLPTRRGGFVQEAVVSGHKVFLRTGEYPDGSLGEIFIDMYKEGAAYRGLINCFAVLTSKALQYGVPLEELVDTFTFTRFEPAGPVDGHENIKTCTSILDLIFRILGFNYLGNTEFVHVKPAELHPPHHAASSENGHRNGAHVESAAPVLEPRDVTEPRLVSEPAWAGVSVNGSGGGGGEAGEAAARARSKQAGYTGESCSSCGSIRVLRNGTCIVCEDCGTTSGCS